MKHLAAYLLLGLGGNTSPSAADVKAVLDSVGVESDDERLEKLISELKGKDISEVRLGNNFQEGSYTDATFKLISEGSAKLASVPSGGGGGAAPAAGGAAAGGAAPAEEKAAEKEEGTFYRTIYHYNMANNLYREGRVRRGHGFRSFRLNSQNHVPLIGYHHSKNRTSTIIREILVGLIREKLCGMRLLRVYL